MDASLAERVRAHLAGFHRLDVSAEGLRRAAVAVSLATDDSGQECFLITRRALTLRSHAGQWALPGGRIDEGEEPQDAALRELGEEVGLDLGPESILGLLDDYPTRSGFLITPVVMWAGESPATSPNPKEVDSVHLVPLAELERRDLPRFLPGPDKDRPIIQMEIFSRMVHAPTGAILYQLRELALHGRPTRVAHFDQPSFAWQ